MADYRRDYDGRHRRPAREGADRTDQVRSWFGDDKARQRRGNEEREDRFPYGGDREGSHDEWRSHPYTDAHREDRSSRWEGVHAGPRGDRGDRGYYAAQTFGAYRTDDRSYHDRYRTEQRDDTDRERDHASWDGGRRSRSSAADEYFRAAREQRDDLVRYEAQSPGAEFEDRTDRDNGAGAPWASRERGGYWRQHQGRSPYAGRGPKDYRRSDDRVREEVCDLMTDDPMLDASEITVQVSEGVVTLSGSVTSREQKRRAEDVAESISGVKDVANQLRVAREAIGHDHAAPRPVTQSETGTPSKSSSTTA